MLSKLEWSWYKNEQGISDPCRMVALKRIHWNQAITLIHATIPKISLSMYECEQQSTF